MSRVQDKVRVGGTHFVEGGGSTQVKQEGILKERVEELLVIHAIHTLQEEDNALLVGWDEARWDVAAALLSSRVGECEAEGQHTLYTHTHKTKLNKTIKIL